jgi:hypothetical protein
VSVSFAELQRQLLMHAVERPPKAVGIFTKRDVEVRGAGGAGAAATEGRGGATPT